MPGSTGTTRISARTSASRWSVRRHRRAGRPVVLASVDRQLSITLDDLLVEDGKIAPFHRVGPNYTAMGRFGNVMLINGETELWAKRRWERSYAFIS